MTKVQQTTIDQSIYRKNLRPVVYVTGDVAGEIESPVYAILKMSDAIDKIQLPDGYQVRQYKGTTLPESTEPLLDEMGWRVAHHRRSVSRPRAGVCRRAGVDLRAGGGLVQIVHHAAGDHGADSADAGGHSAGACADGSVLSRQRR